MTHLVLKKTLMKMTQMHSVIESETKKKSWDVFGWFEETIKYVSLSVVRDKVEIGPQKNTMGYVAYTKDSSNENKVSSIGIKFK